MACFWKKASTTIGPSSPLTLDREDDFFTYGGEVEFEFEWASLGVTVSRTEFDSNLPDFSRDKNRISVNLRLGKKSMNRWF